MSKYTDTENRRSWGKLDKDALNYTISEYEVDYSRIGDVIEEFDLNSNDINAHFYGALYVAGVDFVDKVKEYSLKYKNIYFHEAVKPEVLLNYTSSADVGFCLIENSCKSYDFCMPNKMFEYLMAGIPVIATKLFELKRFVKKNEIGLLIDSYNDISNIIDKINNQVISQYKQNIENVKLIYNWEEQEKILKTIYKELNKC